jgi:hypothetical protein
MKKVLVLPVVDQAGVGKAKATAITTTFTQLLNEDDQIKVYKANKPMSATIKTRSPEFGIVIDPNIARRAEEMGMNVLITMVLNPFEISLKKSGIWPFRKLRPKAEVSVLVNAVDIINGTLFLTHLETEEIKIPEEISDWEAEKKKIDDYVLEEVLPDLLEEQASAVSSGLEDHPWWGRVISVDTNTVMINGGNEIGLTEGRTFEVFAIGESIRSVSGKSIYLLGPKVGEIKTTQVMKSSSSAVPLNGGDFKPGQVIKIKD